MKTLFGLLTAAAFVTVMFFITGQAAMADKAVSPGDTVKAFARAMEANDVNKVKEIVPELGELLGDDKLKAIIKQASDEIKAEGGIKSITTDKEEIKGDTAKVTSTLENGKGEKETEEFELEKVDGKWVIGLGLEEKPPVESPPGE